MQKLTVEYMIFTALETYYFKHNVSFSYLLLNFLLSAGSISYPDAYLKALRSTTFVCLCDAVVDVHAADPGYHFIFIFNFDFHALNAYRYFE